MSTTQPQTNGLRIFGIALSLRGAVNRLEESIITLSGPAIAISGIIAGIDLLTGGSMFKDIQWLSLTWAICLLLTLDFQVLMLGARAKQTYSHPNKSARRKVCEILIIIAIAAGISSVSVQMQSIIARTQATVTYTDSAGQHTRNLTIDEATRDMGINPVALIWERSALVLVLIFMSGWFRDEEKKEETPVAAPAVQQPATPPTSSISEQDMQRILAALSEVAEMRNELRELRTVQVQEVPQPALPEQAESKTPPSDADKEPVRGEQKGEQADFNYGALIADLYQENTAITVTDIVEKVGCSRSTANKWLNRVRPDAGANREKTK
jgi:hypothetical protein